MNTLYLPRKEICKQCEHISHAVARTLAAQPCFHCQKPLGFNRTIVRADGIWAHEKCVIGGTPKQMMQRSLARLEYLMDKEEKS